MSKKVLYVLALLLATSFNAISQNQAELKASALRDANLTSAATLKMDFETVLKYTLPKVVTIMGGKDKALTLLESTFEAMEKDGFIFEKADVIDVSAIAFEEGEYRCVVEVYNQMQMSGMRIKSKNHLFGMYNQSEAFWYFIEAKQLKNTVIMDQVLPNFSTSLNIPENTMDTEEIKE